LPRRLPIDRHDAHQRTRKRRSTGRKRPIHREDTAPTEDEHANAIDTMDAESLVMMALDSADPS